MLSFVGCANDTTPTDTIKPTEVTTPIETTLPTESVPETVPQEHIYVAVTTEATCSNKGQTTHTCECGDTYIDNEIEMLPHDYETVVTDVTCITNGITTSTCKVCGNIELSDEILAVGHKYESKTTKATYTKKGYTIHTCSVCGDSYKDNYTDIIPHEHEYTKKVKAPTCTKKGYTTYTCSLCEKSYKANAIKATGHTSETTVIEPTYTEKGYTLYKCSNCDESYKDNYTDIIPHEHEYAEKVTNPTCTKTGYTTHTCSLCGNSYKDNETSATGHTYETKTVAPTGKTEGYDIHTCSACGDSYKDNYTEPVVTWTEVNETVYAKSEVNIRKGPGTSYKKIDSLKKGDSVKRVAKGDNDWSKVEYNGEIVYVSSNYLTTEKSASISTNGYPKTYSDSTAKITIYKEWYQNAWCYAAHLEFTSYDRLGTTSAKGKYNSGLETTSKAAKRIGAIFCVNGDYAIPSNGAGGYCVARDGKVCNDKKVYSEGIYNSNTGLLTYRADSRNDVAGKQLSDMVAAGKVTDTFQFGPALVINGKLQCKEGGGRAQRTFIGTNGNPGDIWVVVSDGRKNDGESSGLTGYQCAKYLINKGCTFVVPLDGGGSSTMYFNGKVLNAARNGQRAVADFLYFK
jgi:exopolysaccharide biosynthesis protein